MLENVYSAAASRKKGLLSLRSRHIVLEKAMDVAQLYLASCSVHCFYVVLAYLASQLRGGAVVAFFRTALVPGRMAIRLHCQVIFMW